MEEIKAKNKNIKINLKRERGKSMKSVRVAVSNIIERKRKRGLVKAGDIGRKILGRHELHILIKKILENSSVRMGLVCMK